jgi:hypothetical protein
MNITLQLSGNTTPDERSISTRADSHKGRRAKWWSSSLVVPFNCLIPSEDLRQKFLAVQIQSIHEKLKQTIDAKTGE